MKDIVTPYAPLNLNDIRPVCGVCFACGCEECFQGGDCRYCGADKSVVFKEQKNPKTLKWEKV